MNILVLSSNMDHGSIKNAFNDSTFTNGNQLYLDGGKLDEATLASIDVVIGWDPVILPKILALPNSQLKWVQAYSAGVDYFPLATLKEKHVLLSNVSGIHAEPIAESVIGMILSFYRGLHFAAVSQVTSSWATLPVATDTIVNKRLTIFGTGHIATRIAELATAFKMDITGVNHSGHPAAGFPKTISIQSLDSLELDRTDVIVNTLPLTEQTRGFFNADFFKHLDNHPLFVTIGRGPSTVTDDLVAALKSGQLGSAALDVTDPEPLPASSPLWQMSNAIITPHISGLYKHYLRDVAIIFSENLTQFEKDGTLARNQVNLDLGY